MNTLPVAPSASETFAPSGEYQHDQTRPAIELGKRAVSALVNSEYGQKVTGMVRGAVRETGMAAAVSGARSLGERFGISYENGELSVQKTKLAREAIRLALNPYAESVRAAKAVGKDAYKAGRQEARSQAFSAGRIVSNDAFGYMNRRAS